MSAGMEILIGMLTSASGCLAFLWLCAGDDGDRDGMPWTEVGDDVVEHYGEGEVGDDTIAMLCPCCNGAPFPAANDCICTADCGVPRCQAGCPAHIEGCGSGANMLAYPSLACRACDEIAARLEGGDDRG